MFKKLFPIVVLLGLIIAGVRLFSGPEDTWKQNNEGAWIRHGNPALPIPENVVHDCYQQNNNRAFDIAYILCREDLCGSDRACARFLETAFEEINASNELKTTADANASTSGSLPQPITTDQNPETNIQPQITTPTTTPTSTVSITTEGQVDANTNTNLATPEPSQPVAQTPTTPQESPKTNPNITIETPTSGSAVTSPIVITGRVKAAAGEPIDIQITTKSGTVLIGETANLKTSGPDGWGSYKITIAYQFSSTREGYIVISHGSDTASVPVTFN